MRVSVEIKFSAILYCGTIAFHIMLIVGAVTARWVHQVLTTFILELPNFNCIQFSALVLMSPTISYVCEGDATFQAYVTVNVPRHFWAPS
jgi:hypothetical protein